MYIRKLASMTPHILINCAHFVPNSEQIDHFKKRIHPTMQISNFKFNCQIKAVKTHQNLVNQVTESRSYFKHYETNVLPRSLPQTDTEWNGIFRVVCIFKLTPSRVEF